MSLPSAPSTPTFTSVSAAGFTVNWLPVSGATSYLLEVSPSISFFPVDVRSLGSTSTGFTSLSINTGVTPISPGTAYYARVRAVNSEGVSAYSSVSTATTLATNSALSVGIATKTSISADLRRQGFYRIEGFFYDEVDSSGPYSAVYGSGALPRDIYHRTDELAPSVFLATGTNPVPAASSYGSVASFSVNTNACVPVTFYSVAAGIGDSTNNVGFEGYTPSVNKQIKTTAGVLVATLSTDATQPCTWLAGSMSFATAKSGVIYEAFDTGTSNNPVSVKIFTVKSNATAITYSGGGKYTQAFGEATALNVYASFIGQGQLGQIANPYWGHVGGLDVYSVYVDTDAGSVDFAADVSTSTRLSGAVSGSKVLLDVGISQKTSFVATIESGTQLNAVVSSGAPTYADDGVLIKDGWSVGTSIESDLQIAPKVELVARPRSKTSIRATITANVGVQSIVAGESIISVNVAGPTGIEADLALSTGRYTGTLIKSYVIPAKLNMSSSLRVNDDLFRINPLKVETSVFTATSIKADLGYIKVELAATLAGSASLAASVARLTLLGTSDLRQVNIFEAGKVSSNTIGGLGQRWVKRSDLQNNDLTTSVEWVEGSPPQLD